MTTYNTGNPLGSTAVKDLYDNSQNFDTALNTSALTWIDRGPSGIARTRRSWAGLESQVDDFLLAFGNQYIGEYAAGLIFTARNQYTVRQGVAYRPATGSALPLTLTGTWVTDQPKLFAFNADAVLRSDLAAGTGSGIVGTQQALTGAKIRTLREKLSDEISALDFNGVYPDGSADSTSGLRAALATGRNIYVPQGTYVISNTLVLAALGQKIRGDGRFKTVFKVDTNFSMGAVGIFQSAGIAVEYEDLAIEFAQPDTVNRALLTQYPAAISGIGVPGQRLTRCRISRAWNGLDWRDNAGQSSVQDLLISAFNYGSWIDGAVDSIRLNDYHFWPSECTLNQTEIMKLPNCIGVNSGRAEDLKIHNGLFFCGKPMRFFSGTRANAGPTFGVITNTDLDGFGGIDIDAGDITFIGGYQSTGGSSFNKLNQTGGNLLMSGVNFNIGAAFSEADPFMRISGALTRASITGCIMRRFNYDVCLLRASNGATVIYNDNQIQHDPNVNYNYAFIYSDNNCRVTAQSNRTSDLGGGAADFFRMPAGSEGSNDITNNVLYGHGLVFSGARGVYAPNLNTYDFIGNVVTGTLKTMRFRGNLDASGNASQPHGVSGMNVKVLNCSGVYKGSSGEARNLPNVAADGTNVILSGGLANQPYKATLVYTETVELW